ncbi:MAG: hypothetical protein LKJ90_04785 [Faecalibacterium sp.]|jgi:hypothetical protein|nr:hypothetical protein [Faecalibacterium sp.]
MKKTKRRATAPIPILIYLLTLVGWLIFSTALLTADQKAQKQGLMPTQAVTQSDFSLLNVLKANDKLVCITTDPQLWWYNYDGIRVRTLTMTANYSKNPLEICLFYLKDGQADFSLDQRVYPVQNEDGTYTFTLPTTKVSRLRLDICSDTCVIRDFAVTINAPRPAWRYYVPSNWYLFLMLILPGLAASAVSLLHNNIVLYLRHGGPLSAEEIRAAVDQEDDDILLDALEPADEEPESLPDETDTVQKSIPGAPNEDTSAAQTAAENGTADEKTNLKK